MIYIHIPFCKSFCSYCGFYSEIACKAQYNEYLTCLCKEIDKRRCEIEATKGYDTLYIGGGTPSVLPPIFIEKILNCLGKRDYEEFTIELNPDDLNSDYVSQLARLGVNRISMGVQSLDDKVLKWMNRRHNSTQAIDAYKLLRTKFSNISLDLILGISDIQDTLDKITELRPNHISAYQLSIEDGSKLASMIEKGEYIPTSDEYCRSQYDIVCKRLEEAGYIHYEISSWALAGFESKHNSGYWKRVPYIGLGPGAHSFDGKKRSWNSEELNSWTSSYEILSDLEAKEEEIMLGLRTANGIDSKLIDPKIAKEMINKGLLIQNASRIRIPEDHFFVADDIISQII